MSIIQAPNLLLNTKCTTVNHGTDLKDLCSKMISEVTRSGGCGIAAPQIGVTVRVIWVCCSAYTGIVINPQIIESSGNMEKSREGCLSLKGHSLVNVQRDRKILLTGFNQDWEPLGIEAKNQSAFVFQHEIDHLNGITLLDHKKGN